MPLRLARIGVPLAQTASAGLTAAGLSPVLLSPPESSSVSAAEPELVAAAHVPELPPVAQPPVEEVSVPEVESPADVEDVAPESGDAVYEPVLVDLELAGRDFMGQYGVVPSAEQFAAFLARDYGLTDQDTGGLRPDALLEPVLAELWAADADAAVLPAPVPVAAELVTEAPVTEAPAAAAAAYGEQLGAGEPHPFFGEPSSGRGLSQPSAEPVEVPAGAVPVPTASVTAAGPAVPAGRSFEQPVLSAPAEAEGRDWVAEVAASGEAAARVPRQQADEVPVEADPVQRDVELVASWLVEAEEAGKRLSGAEVARRLEVSPKTGQRRVLEAKQYLEEKRRQQGRAHLRSVGGS